jgi:SOS response regulatory protein OraA/RecX
VGEALAAATRALARRDYSERGLRERLLRAGIETGELDETLEELRHVGLLDDERFASRRARALAERGKGDTAIRFDLRRQGIDAELIEHSLADLQPERERAERIVSRRGPGPKTARLLASRGFDREAVELAAEEPIAPER